MWGQSEDVTIYGPGLINGKGLTREESRLPGGGNKAISLKLCKNVILKISPCYTAGISLCWLPVDNLTIHNLKE